MAELPFDPGAIPEPLRAAVASIVTHPLEAEEAIKDWLATGGERRPDILVALAWACWEGCVRIMVDEGLVRGAEALGYLDESGLGSPEVQALRERIFTGVQHAREQEGRTRRMLERPVASLTPARMSTVAFELGERGRHEESAGLYLRAASRRGAMSDDNAARATLQLAEAGLWDIALPRLFELAEGDLGRRLPDTWQAMYAWGHLLQHALGDTPRLVDLWTRARARMGPTFPVMRPTQLKLLQHALAADVPELGRPLADMVAVWPARSRTPASREAVAAARAKWG